MKTRFVAVLAAARGRSARPRRRSPLRPANRRRVCARSRLDASRNRPADCRRAGRRRARAVLGSHARRDCRRHEPWTTARPAVLHPPRADRKASAQRTAGRDNRRMAPHRQRDRVDRRRARGVCVRRRAGRRRPAAVRRSGGARRRHADCRLLASPTSRPPAACCPARTSAKPVRAGISSWWMSNLAPGRSARGSPSIAICRRPGVPLAAIADAVVTGTYGGLSVVRITYARDAVRSGDLAVPRRAP